MKKEYNGLEKIHNEQQTKSNPLKHVAMCDNCFYSRPCNYRPDDNITCYWDELTYSRGDKCEKHSIVQYKNNADVVRWKLDT